MDSSSAHEIDALNVCVTHQGYSMRPINRKIGINVKKLILEFFGF
jgi:hypothetical protein